MRKQSSYENGFLIFEDYNFVIYSKWRGRRICWHAKNKYLSNFNVGTCFYKRFQNYNFSHAKNSVSLKLSTENKLFEKVEQNIKWLIKFIIRIKKNVKNIYLFVSFISTKCILKMSTFYYLKYIVEKIYEHKLETSIRVVLPISDLHKLYTYIYFENFSFINYYEKLLSKKDVSRFKRYYCPVILLNSPNKNFTLPYEKVYGQDVIKMIRIGKCRKSRLAKYTHKKGEIFQSGEKVSGLEKTTNEEPPIKQHYGNVKKEEGIIEINVTSENKHHRRKRNGKNVRRRKNIKIQKYKIKRVIGKRLHTSDIGLFAGTFDKIHFGHILLLFYSVLLTKKFYYIGLYNNKNIYNKKYAHEIDDLKLRIYHISDILFLIKNVYHIHFFFHNFTHVMPFIKIKNSHKILFNIIINQKNELQIEYHKRKYQKYMCYSSAHFKKNSSENFTKNSKDLKKYLSLGGTKIGMTLCKGKINDQNELFCRNKMKRKILKYLLFHVSNRNGKKFKNNNNKIVVLKRIHDPFSFAVDINDLYCLTMSKESEANGYNVVKKREMLREDENVHSNKMIRGKKLNEEFKELKMKDEITNEIKKNMEKSRTNLNIFDTIDLGDGEKISSTLVRKENYFLKKKKFSKILRYFIDACLFFHIDHFLIQMYSDIFLHKNGRTPFKKLYINNVKHHFCKNEKNKRKKKKKKKEKLHNRSGKKEDNFIVNDFFRHLFVLLSFFVNHFADKEEKLKQNKIQLFMNISLSLSFFFYNNMILLIIKRKEQLINENFSINHKHLEQKISMFHAYDDNILRIYMNNVEEHFLEEILNQVLIWTLLLLSLSIMCKLYHLEILPRSARNKSIQLVHSDDIPKEQQKQSHKMINQKEVVHNALIYTLSSSFISNSKNCDTCKVPKKLHKRYNIYGEDKNQSLSKDHDDSLLRKINYSLYFSNYSKDKGLHRKGSIVTAYTLYNHALTRFKMRYPIFRYFNIPQGKKMRIAPFLDKEEEEKVIPCSYKIYTNDVPSVQNTINPDSDKTFGIFNKTDVHNYPNEYNDADLSQHRRDRKGKFSENHFWHVTVGKNERKILNNMYDINIRSKENIPIWKGKTSVNDIEKYIKGTTACSNSNHSERYASLMQININNNDEIFFFRKILIYKFLDNYFISFFSFYCANNLMNSESKKSTPCGNTKVDDFLYVFLVNFEKHIEMIINSFIQRRWELKPKKSNDPFDPYLQYQKKYSIIHRYLIMNLSPLNNYNIDFERKYNVKNGETTFADTPFRIHMGSSRHSKGAKAEKAPKNARDGKGSKDATTEKHLNVLTFYSLIIQSILTHENYYYPYFSSLNYLYLDNV
ncbi:phosphopantetheine adenylyltransferase [Plasmodium gonderi]|uniref:Phosphopantetheine adenylyltransferase n=1 Tax=Plasmodium gonderi TaxID=77519 RepID=A0A1Y1J8P9_PLAGO|nr:phosphopantetheine adenylyltransferase [Plasmodium gonderi]GAW78886.1 phosphopantetheine adenylyltransferase [Plasmodium gonderi]